MSGVRAPIGVFDSGVGGLTVFAEIARALPSEDIVYLGDTARVPYGTKSRETVIEYARGCAGVLLEEGVRLLVIACNTASAHAMESLEAELSVPGIGVVEPGARAAVRQTRTGRIGVIGTKATIESGAYARAIAALAPDARVFAQACPLFVPLAEEGWTDGEIAEGVARHYLRELLEKDIDVLVLGCTHYPMLSRTIARVCGEGVVLVDSASETARAVAAATDAAAGGAAHHRFLVTDSPESFRNVGARFVGHPLEDVSWINLGSRLGAADGARG
jgi:glutamate racemase